MSADIVPFHRPYQPSNGTEGCAFWDEFCDYCERDRAFREAAEPAAEDGCEILARSLAFDITDPRYPREWCYVDNKPTCTAFERELVSFDGTKPPTPRCSRTLDMFDQEDPDD